MFDASSSSLDNRVLDLFRGTSLAQAGQNLSVA
jgi:hypothetical protein